MTVWVPQLKRTYDIRLARAVLLGGRVVMVVALAVAVWFAVRAFLVSGKDSGSALPKQSRHIRATSIVILLIRLSHAVRAKTRLTVVSSACIFLNVDRRTRYAIIMIASERNALHESSFDP